MCWVSKLCYVTYVYFSSLNSLWSWKNHSFFINSTALFCSCKHALTSVSVSLKHSLSDNDHDVKKLTDKMKVSVMHNAVEAVSTISMTLIIKKNINVIRLLKLHNTLLTLLNDLYLQNLSSKILKCNHILLISDDIRIMSLIVWIHAHSNVKLVWSVKSSTEALIKKTNIILKAITDKEIVIDEQLNIETLLRSET